MGNKIADHRRKRRIGLFVPSFRGGGAERAMLIFGEELLRRGFDVDFLVGSSNGPLQQLIPTGMRVIDLETSRTLSTLPKLIRYLRTDRPSALYATIVHSNVVALLAGLFSRTHIPVIVRESNVPVTEPKNSWPRWITFKLVPWVYPLAKGVIAVSDGVAAELRTLLPGHTKSIHVAPTPAISAELFERADAPLDHPWFAPGSPPVILGAARLQPHKGFVMLVRAFAELRKNGSPARLVILGEGPDRDRVLAEADALGVRQFVDLPGFAINPFPFMKLASVFVLASEYEGMPNVLIQAMALGTPAVATDCKSGPREILCDGKFGELIPVGDVDALTAALGRALQSDRRSDAAAEMLRRFGVSEATDSYLAIAGIGPSGSFQEVRAAGAPLAR